MVQLEQPPQQFGIREGGGPARIDWTDSPWEEKHNAKIAEEKNANDTPH